MEAVKIKIKTSVMNASSQLCSLLKIVAVLAARRTPRRVHEATFFLVDFSFANVSSGCVGHHTINEMVSTLASVSKN